LGSGVEQSLPQKKMQIKTNYNPMSRFKFTMVMKMGAPVCRVANFNEVITTHSVRGPRRRSNLALFFAAMLICSLHKLDLPSVLTRRQSIFARPFGTGRANEDATTGRMSNKVKLPALFVFGLSFKAKSLCKRSQHDINNRYQV